jgi:hypothetical protein
MSGRKGQYMMATKCYYHGDDTPLILEEPELCVVFEENDENYIGNWVEGFGFINLRFPRETTRPLTSSEKEHYHNRHMYINSTPVGPLNMYEEG